jgi:hypothetical protein
MNTDEKGQRKWTAEKGQAEKRTLKRRVIWRKDSQTKGQSE